MRSLVGRAKRAGSRSLVEQLASLTSSGDGSTLSLDFTTGVLDQRLSFSRSTNATFINSQGYVQYADANMMTGSENLDPALYGWGAQNGATYLFDTSVADPNGILGTPRLASSPTIGSAAVNSSTLSVAGGITYTLTFWIRAGTASDFLVGLFETSAFAPATGTILSGPGSISGTGAINISGLTSAWTKVRIYITPAITAANRAVSFYPQGAQAGGLTNYVWGAQFNIGQTPNPTYFRTVATAYQAPRFDYDPTTLTPRGLLIEASASTLNQYSEDFSNAYWSKPNASVSSSSVTGPDNVAGTTRRIVEDNTTNQHGLRRSFSITSGVTYTMSVFVKPGSYDSFGFEMYASASNNAKAEVTSISGNTQTVTSASGVNATLARTPMAASGWYRYALTFTSTATQSGDFNILIKQTNSYAGNGTNYMDVYGFMLESGSGASSYIPTVASQGNRARDVCNITGSNFSSWFVDGPGTIVAQSDNVKFNTRNLLCEFNKDASNYIQMGVAAGAGSGEALLYNPDGFSQSGTTPSLNTAYKSAYVWDTNYFKMCLNGTLGSADTIGNIVSSGMVNLSIGGDLTNPTDVYIKNGHIRSLKYWPTRLPDAQLQALTT
jgi:hypothetical protein